MVWKKPYSENGKDFVLETNKTKCLKLFCFTCQNGNIH